jgi:hypothetical protein
MHARRLSIILLLGALWTAPAARADDGTQPATVARQNYTYDPNSKSITLDLKTIYSGRDADLFRQFYAKAGGDGYRHAKLGYYRTMYDAVAEAAPPMVKDDRERNTIEMTERYTISLADLEDDQQLHRFPIYPDLMRGFFSRLPPLVHHPYPLDPGFNQRDIVTVDAPTLGLYAIPGATVSSPYFTFTRSARALAGHLEMDYRLRFLLDNVPAGEFEQYRSDIEQMDHNIYAWIDIDRDFYHRHYRDIPKMVRGAGLAALLILPGAAYWLVRHRRLERARQQ